MARITALLSSALLAATASAHFEITIPGNQLGGDNTDSQSTGPCGGHTVADGAETVDFHVGGQPVAIFDGHSRSDWLIRGTLDTDASGGWEELYPIYQTRGEGRSCQPSVKAPEEWVGKSGILSVVGQAEDGTLYAVSCGDMTVCDSLADLIFPSAPTSLSSKALPRPMMNAATDPVSSWNLSRTPN
jgi:hypothetical protein